MDKGNIVTALQARTNFGRLLKRVESEGESLIIEKRGTPRAVLLSIRDYVRLAVPEPAVLRVIGIESTGKGAARMGWRDINHIIRKARASKPKAASSPRSGRA